MNDKKIDDGGPAFPMPYTTDTTGPAGMTLRDYFAAKALPQIQASIEKITSIQTYEALAQVHGLQVDHGFEGVAQLAATVAYKTADAMLKERNHA